jgi:hypothetical protein
MFRELMAIMTSQMMTSRSLICLLENQNGGKLQNGTLLYEFYKTLDCDTSWLGQWTAVGSAPTERVSQCVL